VLEATLRMSNGRVAVLAVPDPFNAFGTATGRVRGNDVVFVAVSPRFGDQAVSVDAAVLEDPAEPPIRIDGLLPEIPAELAGEGAVEPVRLRIVVRDDGSVDGVQVLEVPDGRAAALRFQAAARAVRQWRYLPARDQGRPVHAWLEVAVEFAGG
jgi:TonB family protein